MFLRNYPRERPIIYVTKWVQHPVVSTSTCEIDYDAIYKWSEHCKLVDLVRKLQQEFATRPPIEQNELQTASHQLDDYLRQVESLRSKPAGTQPPPPPQINLENVLGAFEQQEHLHKQCEEKNQMYLFAAQEYSENASRVRCISERFGKGKILRELEKELEKQVEQVENSRIDDVLKKYYEARKQYHRIKILKELYLDN